MADKYTAAGDFNGFSFIGQGGSYTDTSVEGPIFFNPNTGLPAGVPVHYSADGVTPGSGDFILKYMNLEQAVKVWWSLLKPSGTIEIDDPHYGTDSISNEEITSYSAGGLPRLTTPTDEVNVEKRVNFFHPANPNGSYTMTVRMQSLHKDNSLIMFDSDDFVIQGYGWENLIRFQCALLKRHDTPFPGPPNGISTAGKTVTLTSFHRTENPNETVEDVEIDGIPFIKVTTESNTGPLCTSNPFTVEIDNFVFEEYS